MSAAPWDRSLQRSQFERRFRVDHGRSPRAAAGQEGTVDGRAKIDDNRAIRQCATYLCIDPRRSLSSGHFEAFDMTVDNACRVCSLEFDHMVNLPMFSAIMFPAQTA
jgi:hypothetical protein